MSFENELARCYHPKVDTGLDACKTAENNHLWCGMLQTMYQMSETIQIMNKDNYYYVIQQIKMSFALSKN